VIELAVPERPIWVKCFPARLNQVFLNLLKNAVHALGGAGGSEVSEVRGVVADAPRGGRILVTAELARGRLRIEIRDTGPGIEPERLQNIFDLDFSRQGSRVKLRLGLPASRGAVEAIGGKLTLESEVGRGSVAIIELPLAETPRGALTTPAPSSPPRDPAAVVAVAGPPRVATAAPVS
jgi:signal transduction histidine kinase